MTHIKHAAAIKRITPLLRKLDARHQQLHRIDTLHADMLRWQWGRDHRAMVVRTIRFYEREIGNIKRKAGMA